MSQVMSISSRESKRNSITMDGGGPYFLRLHFEFPDDLVPYGCDRIVAALGEAMNSLKQVADRSDPSSLNFEIPTRS